jgi:serine protease Do
MGRALRAALVLSVSTVLVGFGPCKKADDGDEGGRELKKKDDLPTAATPVSSPTAGIGQPIVVPPPLNVPAGAPQSFAPLARVAEPAVVTIYIKQRTKKGREFKKGLGSGFLIDKQGTILTNNHVVDGGNAIDVELFNGKVLEGKIVGTDPMTDVGVVKIDPPEGVSPLPLGDSNAVSVGDWVFAIGNPLGLTHTVTAGILSARGRSFKDVPIKSSVDQYFDFLQTDAAINPGNSGGPLLNLKGEVIGINTAINAAGQGLAFAIPINMVKQMLPSLVKEGRLVRSYLGVGIEDAPLDEKTGVRGAIITRVYKGTPAGKAGLQSGDQVVAVDGASVKDSSQMRWLVSIAGVGKTVTLRVIRDAKTFDLPVKLEKLPEQRAPKAGPPSDDDDDDSEEGPFGFPHP